MRRQETTHSLYNISTRNRKLYKKRATNPQSKSTTSSLQQIDAYTTSQGRNHRGGQKGRVPRAPYHVPLHQSDNRHQFVFGADF